MQRIERLKESPSQTAGPYVHIGALPNFAGIEGVYECEFNAGCDTGSGPVELAKFLGEGLGGCPVAEAASWCGVQLRADLGHRMIR